MTVFDTQAREKFAEIYPDKPGMFRHSLSSPLLSFERLAELAARMPKGHYEKNLGDLPMMADPDILRANGLTPEETVRRIHECESWMVLKWIETDPEYAELARAARAEVSDIITAATGRILQPENFAFISSSSAMTPSHIDPEHNILFQIEGEKEVCVYSQDDRELVSQETIERFTAHSHRNVLFNEALADRGVVYRLRPGDALHVPLFAPHWVRVTAGPSLSLSVTWQSRSTLRARYIHRINHEMRRRGANPRWPGEAPVLDALKYAGASAVVRAKRLFH